MRDHRQTANHDVWLAISIILDIVTDDLTPRRLKAASQIERSQLIKLRKLGADLSDISASDLPVMADYDLDQLNETLRSIIEGIRSWADDGNELDIAKHVDRSSSIVKQLPRSQLSDMRTIIRQLKTASDHDRNARKELEERLSQQTEEIATLQRSIAAIDSSFRREYDSIVADSRAKMAAQEKRVDNTINNIQERINEAERLVTNRANNLLHEKATSFRNQADTVLAELNEYQSQARELLQVTGETATATDYGRHANEEKQTANRLRAYAAAFFASSFLWVLLSALFPTIAGDDAWASLIVRTVGAIALIGGGLYLARESANHRHQEVHARAKELDLKAIDPFMVNLPPEFRDEIKALAARRLFAEVNSDGTNQSGSGHPYERLAEAVVALASRSRTNGGSNDTNSESS